MSRAALLVFVSVARVHAAPAVSIHTTETRVNVTLERATTAEAQSLALSVDGGARVPALSISADDSPVAIEIVVCTSEWLDGKTNARIAEVVRTLEEALPESSTIQVIGYDDRVYRLARRTQARTAPWPITSHFLELRPRRGKAFLAALQLGIEQLAESATDRRLLVAFTDGIDDGALDLAPAAIAQRADELRVDLRAIVDRGAGGNVVAIPAALFGFEHAAELVKSVSGRYVATFDAGLLPRDGRAHRFELYATNDRLASISATLPRTSPAESSEPSTPIVESWLAAVVGGLGLGALAGTALIVALSLRKRRLRAR